MIFNGCNLINEKNIPMIYLEIFNGHLNHLSFESALIKSYIIIQNTKIDKN